MLEKLADYYIEREDPVKKAERALAKKAAAAESGSASSERSEQTESVRSESDCSELVRAKSRVRPRKSATSKRKPLTAHQIHTVNARDGRRCAFIDASGNRCPNERWLHIHHVQSVARGGTNTPENLITLCSRHHQLVHQFSSTLRAPTHHYH